MFKSDVKGSPSSDEIEAGEKAEELFRDFCDDSGITYLYIDQSSYNKSSRLVKGKAARPDFLIMEPHKMPIFIDVKAHQLTTPGGEPNFFLNDVRNQAVFLSVKRDFLPLRRLQTLVGIPIWLAIFERSGRRVRPEQMYLAPVNAINDFLRGQPKWQFMQVPLECCSPINLKKGGPLNFDVKDETIQKFVEMLNEYIEKKGWEG